MPVPKHFKHDMDWTLCPSRAQRLLSEEPYDSWLAPGGDCIAEFYRTQTGFLVRFDGRADFEINRDDLSVRAIPAIGTRDDDIAAIAHNSIGPLLGNYRGGLYLHASAAFVNGKAIGFLGQSRSGKTTLAASFAKNGFQLLTEDVLDLSHSRERYWAAAKPTSLRLFCDSAEFLLGAQEAHDEDEGKRSIACSSELPFAQNDSELQALFVLGSDHLAPLQVCRLSKQNALAALMPHAFILDVEDKGLLRKHFEKLADMARVVPVLSLDYPRDYARIPQVITAIVQSVECSPSAFVRQIELIG